MTTKNKKLSSTPKKREYSFYQVYFNFMYYCTLSGAQ